jgi:hypothetical protein
VDLICQAVKLKAFQPTPESQNQIEKLAQEALLKLEEKDHISPFFEPMRDSPWRKKPKIKKDNSR